MGSELDGEYGEVPDASQLDPTHLRALAVRLETLAGKIELQREEGKRRDDKIDGVRQTADGIRADLSEVDAEVKKLVRSQMTEEDRATLRAIMSSYAFKEMAWKVILRYLSYAAAIATTVYMLREPIWKLGAALGRVGGP